MNKTHGESEFAKMTAADLDLIGEEIGAHFGYSSVHSIAWDGLRAKVDGYVPPHLSTETAVDFQWCVKCQRIHRRPECA